MKKIIFLFVCVMNFSFLGGEVFAEVPKVGDIFNVKETDGPGDKYTDQSGLRDYTFEGKKTEDSLDVKGEVRFRALVHYIVKYLEKIFVVIAVLFFVWGGAELIIGKGDEEAFKTKNRLILGTATGFLVILLAGVMVDKVFFGFVPPYDTSSKGGIFMDPGGSVAEMFALEGAKQLKGLFQYFTSWVVMAGVAYMIFSALKMIIAGGEDENQITNLKKRIIFTIFGMVILVSTEKFISLFQDSDQKLAMPKVDKVIELIVDWVNFALGFVGILAIVALIWGGVRLVTSMGQDEQSVEDAKRTIFSSIIGLVIAFSAWTLMYYFAVV